MAKKNNVVPESDLPENQENIVPVDDLPVEETGKKKEQSEPSLTPSYVPSKNPVTTTSLSDLLFPESKSTSKQVLVTPVKKTPEISIPPIDFAGTQTENPTVNTVEQLKQKKVETANTPTSTELKQEQESNVGEQQMNANKGAPQTFTKPSDYGLQQAPEYQKQIDDLVTKVTKEHSDKPFAGYLKDYLTTQLNTDKEKFDELSALINQGDDVSLNKVITLALNTHNQTLSNDEKILDARGNKTDFETITGLEKNIQDIGDAMKFNPEDYTHMVTSANNIQQMLQQTAKDYETHKTPEDLVKLKTLQNQLLSVTNAIKDQYPDDLVKQYSDKIAPYAEKLNAFQSDPQKMKGVADYQNLLGKQYDLGKAATDYVKYFPEVVKQLKDQEKANYPVITSPTDFVEQQISEVGKEAWNSVVDAGYNLLYTLGSLNPVVPSTMNTKLGLEKIADFTDANLKFTTSNLPVINEDGSMNYSRILPVLAKSTADIALLIAGAGEVSALTKAAGIGAKTSDALGLFTSSFIQSYPGYVKNAKDHGMNERDASAYGLTLGIGTSALWTLIPNQVSGIIGDLGKTSTDFLKGMTEDAFKELGPKGAMDSANSVLNRFIKGAPSNVGLMYAQKMMENTANYFANKLVPEGKIKMQEEMTKQDVYETTLMGITTSVLMGEYEHYAQKDLIKNAALYEASQNFDGFKEFVSKNVTAGMFTPEQGEKMVKDVEGTILSVNKMPQELSPEKKQQLIPVLAEKMELEEKKRTADKSFAQMYDKNIEVLDGEIQEILKKPKEKPVETLTGDKIEPKTKTDDNKNTEGVQGDLGKGKEPEQTEPVTGEGEKKVETSGIFQTPSEKVAPVENKKTPTPQGVSPESFNVKTKQSSSQQDDLIFTFKDKKKDKIQKEKLAEIEVNVERNNFNRLHISGIAEPLQNKGYGKEIYKSLVDKYGHISTSDASSSKDVQRVWDSLTKSGEYYTGEIGPFKIVSKEKSIVEKFIKDKQGKGWKDEPILTEPKSKTESEGQKLLNEIRLESKDLNYKLVGDGTHTMHIRNQNDNVIRKNYSKAEGNKSVESAYKGLNDRSSEVKEVFSTLHTAGSIYFPQIIGADGKRMSRKRVESAIHDIVTDTPTKGAQMLLDQLEEQVKSGDLIMYDPTSGEHPISVKDALQEIKGIDYISDELTDEQKKFGSDYEEYVNSLSDEEYKQHTQSEQGGIPEEPITEGEGDANAENKSDKETQQKTQPSETTGEIKEPPTKEPPTSLTEEEPYEGEEKEHKIGRRVLDSLNLEKDIKEGLAKKGITYLEKRRELTRAQAKSIIDAYSQANRLQELEDYVMNPNNPLLPDVKVSLLKEFSEKYISLHKEATNPELKEQYGKRAVDTFYQLQKYATQLGRGVNMMKDIQHLTGSDPNVAVQGVHKNLADRNKDVLAPHEETIVSTQEAIKELLKSPEMKTLIEEEVKKQVKQQVEEIKKKNIFTRTTEERKDRIQELKDRWKKAGQSQASASILGLNSEQIEVATELGAEYLALGITNFGKWAKKLADDLGITQEQAGSIWKTAKLNKESDDQERTFEKFAGEMERNVIAQQAEKLKSRIKNLDELIKNPNKIIADLEEKKLKAEQKKEKPEEIKKLESEIADKKKLIKLIGEMEGLTDKQKKEIVGETIDSVIKNGYLSETGFRNTFAKALGLEHLTDADEQRIREASIVIHSVETAAQKYLKDPSKENLTAYKKALFDASVANEKLSTYFRTRPGLFGLMQTFIRGNLMAPTTAMLSGGTNLMNSPVRWMQGVGAQLMDYIRLGLSKIDWLNKNVKYFDNKPAQDFMANQRYYYANFGSGLKEGLRQFITGSLPETIQERELKGGLHPLEALGRVYGSMTKKEKQGFRKNALNLVEGTLGIAPEMMFRVLNITDKPFRRGTESGALGEFVSIDLKEQKSELEEKKKLGTITETESRLLDDIVSGKEEKKRMNVPDPEMIEKAKAEGARAVYQNKNIIAGAMETAGRYIESKIPNNKISKTLFEIGKFFTTTQAPYVNMPLNWGQDVVEYSTFGIIPLAKGMIKAHSGDARGANQQFAKAAMAYMISKGVAWFIQQGIVTGSGDDDDPKTRQTKHEYQDSNTFNWSLMQRILSGKPNDGFQKGDAIFHYNQLGVLGAVMNVQANMYEKYGEDGVAQMGAIDEQLKLLQANYRQLLDNSFLAGTNTLMNAFATGDENKINQWEVSTASTLGAVILPNTVVKFIAAEKDDVLRDVRDPDVEQWIKNSFADRLGLGGGLPKRYSVWGEEIKKTPEGSNRWVYQLVDLTKSKAAPEDLFGIEIYKLMMRTKEVDPLKAKDVIPNEPPKKLMVDGIEKVLSQSEYDDFQHIVGKKRKEIASIYINGNLAGHNFGSDDDATRIDVLQQIYSSAYNLALQQFMALQGWTKGKTSLSEEEKEGKSTATEVRKELKKGKYRTMFESAK